MRARIVWRAPSLRGMRAAQVTLQAQQRSNTDLESELGRLRQHLAETHSRLQAQQQEASAAQARVVSVEVRRARARVSTGVASCGAQASSKLLEERSAADRGELQRAVARCSGTRMRARVTSGSSPATW